MNGAPDWEGETGLGDARSRYDPIPSLGRAD